MRDNIKVDIKTSAPNMPICLVASGIFMCSQHIQLIRIYKAPKF